MTVAKYPVNFKSIDTEMTTSGMSESFPAFGRVRNRAKKVRDFNKT